MESFILFTHIIMPYLIGFIALILVLKSIVLVGGTEIAIVERKYYGKKSQ